VHDVLFNQSGHLAGATVFDCTTLYRVDGTGFASFVEKQFTPLSSLETPTEPPRSPTRR
jgi:hypothetical protein